jgi:exosome complex RNA-binding protein Rrp4
VASRIQNDLILMGRKAGKLAGGQMIFFFFVSVGDAIGTTGSDLLVQIH